MASGANGTPLGRLNPTMTGDRPFTGPSMLRPHMSTLGFSIESATNLAMHGIKRDKSFEDSWGNWDYLSMGHGLNTLSESARKKKRKSRWGGDEKEKAFIPGMPTVLPNNLTPEQEKAYLLQLQIEEISRRLRTGDLGIPPNPEDRSPSPEPIYNNEGKRLNTREYRTRKRLEDDRHVLITQMFDTNPDFKPPADYKPPVVRVSDKVMIPQDEHPDINFVGLLIGPRGNTLKAMEKETGAKIIIRGKGSVKEGKIGRKDGQPLPGEDEPLHAYVTANNPESVKKAVDKIKEILRQGIEVPEGQNDLRRMQLRELALLNGTLRENDGPRCTNCGAASHKSWQCPDKPNITNSVICTNCGGAGHIAKDCREKRPGNPLNISGGVEKSKIDEEYMSLMAELGEGPPPPIKTTNTISQNHNVGIQQQQHPPRAIMAPPPTTSNSTVLQPPTMLNPIMPPPWSTSIAQTKLSTLMNLNQQQTSQLQPPPNLIPPFPVGVMPPWQQSQLSQALSVGMSLPPVTSVSGVPPPTMLAQPPPPPPPGGQTTISALSWQQALADRSRCASEYYWRSVHSNQTSIPPPPQSGVPPPWQTTSTPSAVPPPWQTQSFMGVPPPPVQSSTLPTPPPPPPAIPVMPSFIQPPPPAPMDIHSLNAAALLAAPPPPPPT